VCVCVCVRVCAWWVFTGIVGLLCLTPPPPSPHTLCSLCQGKGRGIPAPVAILGPEPAGTGDPVGSLCLLPVQPSVYLSTTDAEAAASLAAALIASDRYAREGRWEVGVWGWGGCVCVNQSPVESQVGHPVLPLLPPPPSILGPSGAVQAPPRRLVCVLCLCECVVALCFCVLARCRGKGAAEGVFVDPFGSTLLDVLQELEHDEAVAACAAGSADSTSTKVALGVVASVCRVDGIRRCPPPPAHPPTTTPLDPPRAFVCLFQ
jgi:hypothetical protein